MSARLAAGKRIRSIVMSGNEPVVGGGTVQFPILDTHTFQDDVTIIGVTLEFVMNVEDAHSNTDTQIDGYVELSRQAKTRSAGRIAVVGQHMIWNGLFSTGGEPNKVQTIMFPEDFGWEVDEGETVNLLGQFFHLGAGGDMNMRGDATVFYVER